MKNKSLWTMICDLFSGFCPSSNQSDDSVSTQANQPSSDTVTGVERYINNQQAAEAGVLTGVERYIQKQKQAAGIMTGVERYIQQQVNAKQLTGVERYIRNQGE